MTATGGAPRRLRSSRSSWRSTGEDMEAARAMELAGRGAQGCPTRPRMELAAPARASTATRVLRQVQEKTRSPCCRRLLDGTPAARSSTSGAVNLGQVSSYFTALETGAPPLPRSCWRFETVLTSNEKGGPEPRTSWPGKGPAHRVTRRSHRPQARRRIRTAPGDVRRMKDDGAWYSARTPRPWLSA